MANTITITLKAQDDGSIVLERAAARGERAIRRFRQNADRDMGSFTATMKKHWGEIAAGFASIAGVYTTLKKFVDMYAEEEAAIQRLAVALANQGRLTRENLSTLVDYAAQMQRTTSMADDMALSHMAMLSTFGMGERDIRKSVQALADMEVYGYKAETVINLLGKAYLGNTDQLKKLGIIIDDSIPKSERFNAVMEQLNRRFGGAARAELDTYAGKLKQFKNVMGDIGEAIGGEILQQFDKVGWSISKVIEWYEKLKLKALQLRLFFDQGNAALIKEVDAQIFAVGQAEELTRQIEVSISGGGKTVVETLKNQAAGMKLLGDAADEAMKKEKKAVEEAYAAWLKLNEERSRHLESFYNDMLKNEIEITQEMQQAAELYDNWELEAYKDTILQKKKEQDEYQKEYEQQLKDRQEEEQKSFEATRSFFRDMLSGMADDAGSFFDIIVAKLKNVAATLAADTLTSMAMGMFGSSGNTTGSASSNNLMSLLNMGKTGSSLFGFGSAATVTGIASEGGSPYMVAGDLMTGAAEEMTSASSAFAAAMPYFVAAAFGVKAALELSNQYGKFRDLGYGAGKSAAWTALDTYGTLGFNLLFPDVAWSNVFGVGDAQRERAGRSEAYGKEFNRAVGYDVSAGSLADYMGGAESMLDTKSLYSFMKLGGISAEGSGELYRMIAFAKEYKKAIAETGETSALTIGNYQKLTTEMKWFNATAVAWEGKAKGVAEGFKKIQENIKALQLKAVTEDLNNAVGVFTYNMQKLIEIGLEGDELTKAQYEQTLKFLTTDAYPALNGELVKARATFKAAAEEMEHLNNAEEEAAIKAKILASDMELTEQQLEALRTGDVNTKMIELYQALGWTDRELVLVTNDAREAVSIFEAMQEAAESMIGTLDRLKEQYKDVDVSDGLRKTYAAIYQTATAVQILGEAGQKVEALPDTIDAMTEAARNGDLTAFNVELMKTADTLLYLSGIADMINLAKIAAALGTGGQLAAGLYLVIEGFQIALSWADKTSDWFYSFDWGKAAIDEMIGKMIEAGGVVAWLGKKWREALPGSGTVTGTLEGAGLVDTSMSAGGAVGVYTGYRDLLKYQGMGAGEAQLRGINDQATQAVATFFEQFGIGDIQAKLARGEGLTQQELQNLHDFNEIVTTIGQGAELAAQQLKESWGKEYKQFMQPIEDIIATAGMTDAEKAAYNIDRQIEQQMAGLQEMYDAGKITEDKYLEGMWKIVDEREILYDQLEQQQREAAEAEIAAQKKFWEDQIKAIEDARTALEFSSFNLTPGKARAASAAGRYEELKQALLSAQGQEAFQSAYQNFAGFYQTYLQEMQGTYLSSSTYTSAYQDVQSVLAQAQQRAEAEQLAIEKQDETLNQLKAIEEIQRAEKEAQESNVINFLDYKRQFEQYDTRSSLAFDDISEHNSMLATLAAERNGLLTSMNEKLAAIVSNTAAAASAASSSGSGGSKGGSSSRSEPVTFVKRVNPKKVA